MSLSLVATGAATAIGGPGAGAIASVSSGLLGSLEQKWFGGGATDAARQARTDWFHTAAKEGSVWAARIMLGAQANVSSNEWNKEWHPAVSQLQTERPDVYGQAVSTGPYWDSTDNATSDKMRALVNNELASLGASSPGSIPSTQGVGSNVLQPLQNGLAQTVQNVLSGAGTSAARAINPQGSYVTIPTNWGQILLIGAAVLGVILLVRHEHK